MVVWRGVQRGCGVFFQICNRTHLDCLPVVVDDCVCAAGIAVVSLFFFYHLLSFDFLSLYLWLYTWAV